MEKEVRDDFSKVKVMEMSPEMKQYAGFDALVTWLIGKKQIEQRGQGNLSFVPYDEVTSKAIWAVLDMQKVRFDKDAFVGLAKRFGDEGRALQEKLGINVNSPDQARGLVSSILGREVDTTSATLLDPIIGDFDTPDDLSPPMRQLYDLLRIRTLLKMESTYGEKFLETIEPGGYLMPGWKLDGPVTGRMACSSPNLMNVPQREVPEYRYTVIASPDHDFIVSDASQQEPRVGAVLSQDQRLLDLVRTGASIYIKVAEDLLHETIDKKHPRYPAVKASVLGTFYGLRSRTLAKREGIPVAEAKYIQDSIFSNYPQVPIWMHRMRERAFSKGYVETVLGRRMYINQHGEDNWENQAINYPVQGTAAEITKLAFVYMHEEFKARGLPFCINLQVHDELNADCPKEYTEKVVETMQECWTEAGKRIIPDVPFVTEIEHGSNWGCK
jgi:DNA polymerase-1